MERLKVSIGKMPTRILILKVTILIGSFVVLSLDFCAKWTRQKAWLKVAKNVYFLAIYLATSSAHIPAEADTTTGRQSLLCSHAAAPNLSNGLHDNNAIVVSSASLIYSFLLLLPWLVIYREWTKQKYSISLERFTLLLFFILQTCVMRNGENVIYTNDVLSHFTTFNNEKPWKTKTTKGTQKIQLQRKKRVTIIPWNVLKVFEGFFSDWLFLFLSRRTSRTIFKLKFANSIFHIKLNAILLREREIWRVVAAKRIFERQLLTYFNYIKLKC